MDDKKRITRHDAAGHFGKAALVIMHDETGKNGTRPLDTAAHLDDHPACRAGVMWPKWKNQRFSRTMCLKQCDQFCRAISATDEADPGAWLCRPDRRFNPILEACILTHVSQRTRPVAGPRAPHIMIGRVANNMIKAGRQHRRHGSYIGLDQPDPAGKPIVGDVDVGKLCDIGVFFNSGDLHTRKAVGDAQCHPGVVPPFPAHVPAAR